MSGKRKEKPNFAQWVAVTLKDLRYAQDTLNLVKARLQSIKRERESRRASMAADILIPSCKHQDALKPLLADIEATVGGKPRIILSCNPWSAAKNRNHCLAQAAEGPVVMLDDDISAFPAGWNERLVSVLTEQPGCVMASARLLRSDGLPGRMGGIGDNGLFQTEGVYEVKGPQRKLVTACFAFRNEPDIRFDENYVGSGFEDDDLSAQLRRKYPGALFLVVCDVAVIHLNEMKNQSENFERNKQYFQKKWGVQWT